MKNKILSLGSQIEPFVDEALIASRKNVDLKLHDPVAREIVFTFDKPWEQRSPGYCVLLRDDDGRIRMYYRAAAAGGDFSDQQTTALAISEDGIHFERPVFGLIEEDGSRLNNLIWRGVEAHNLMPFLDNNPKAVPDARYKATGGPMWKIYGLCSSDGIHWRKIREEPLAHEGAFDSLNVMFWDTDMGCYRSFSRYFDGGWPKGIRAIQSATSPDFIHWSKPKSHIYSNNIPLEHFYTNATIRYPGHPHLLLSFPKRFIYERKRVDTHLHKGLSDAVFMTSRDGVHWDRRFPEAWVRPGRDLHNWLERNNMIAPGMLELTPGEWSLYMGEHHRRPDSRVRRLTVRAHGFASVHAGYREGEFTTHPLRFEGDRLNLNFATSAVGQVQVEVLRPNGTPFPGYALKDMDPIFGDELSHTMLWKRKGADLSSLRGKTVRFRFVLREADLYAMQIA